MSSVSCKRLNGARMASALANWALLLIFFLFVLLFSLLRPDTFFTAGNLTSVAQAQVVLVILAVATLLPLVIDEFDLSLAANLGLSMVLVAGGPSKLGLGFAGSVILALLISGMIGLVNGLLISYVGVSSFVTTLGMGSIIGGAIQYWTEGAAIFEDISPGLLSFSQEKLLGLALPVFYATLLVVLTWYLLEYTPTGRRMYAIGGSRNAAKLSGIRTRRITVVTFVSAGLIAGFGGIVYAGTLGSGNPSASAPLLLPAFAACFLGAACIKLGVFNVFGTVIAIFTIAAGVTGLSLVGTPPFVDQIFSGVALILGVSVTRYLRKGENEPS